jgi:hypothetical protein
MDFNLITISVSFLDELTAQEAAERIYYGGGGADHFNRPGIYRIVAESGNVDCDYLGDIDQIEIRDINYDSEHFFFERENGVLFANDSEDCAPAQYFRVG